MKTGKAPAKQKRTTGAKVAGDTLEVYWGELLISPVPLELSFNYCSHVCAYCFANLNKPGRRANINATMNLLNEFPERNTIKAKLLQAGYPVLVSNRVDPFAESNYRQAVPVMRHMTELGIPICVQTKGGKGVDEVLEFLPPSVWYISVSQWQDSIRAMIEPGAPSIESRFGLMEKVKAAGHRVVVGFNPLVPEWLPDFDYRKVIDASKGAGAEGIWVERLHMNSKQEVNLSKRELQVLGQPLIDRAKRRRTPQEDLQLYLAAREYTQEVGLEVYSVGQSIQSNFWQPYYDCYPIHFPTMQGFINACYDATSEGLLGYVEFEQFAEALLPYFPKGKFDIGHYFGATAHNLWQDRSLSNWMTYKQVLALLWQEPKVKQCPVRIGCFAYGAEIVDGQPHEILDERRMRTLVFNPDNSFKRFYAQALPDGQFIEEGEIVEREEEH